MKSLFVSRKGYTLIELLVVIGILAVIAAIAIPAVAGLIEKSQATVDNKNAREMANALERFASEYELYKEDLSMNQVDIGNMDAMQGRVFSVVKTTDRSDFSKFEIAEDSTDLSYDNFYINKKTNYPLTEIGVRRVLTTYLKTKVTSFSPLRSGYSFYYSPECGQVVCAKTGSTYEEIEAVAAVSEPYISMSSALVTRTPWSFETNQVGVNQWINLTTNDGKDIMNFNFANVATETLKDYTYLRGFHQYNDTLMKDLFFNGTTYVISVDDNTSDKYLNVLAFAFDKDGNGTVYDHKLEIFSADNEYDIETIKEYCETWAGNWDEYSSGNKAVQMDPNNIDGEIEYIFDFKSNPEHALSHNKLPSGDYCTLYKTPIEINYASFKYEVKSDDTLSLYDFNQANSNTTPAHTVDELVYRYQKNIHNDGVTTHNMLYMKGSCNGTNGYFEGYGPDEKYVADKLHCTNINFLTSIPENSIYDMRDEDDGNDDTDSDEMPTYEYMTYEGSTTKTLTGGNGTFDITIYKWKSVHDTTKYSYDEYYMYSEWQNYPMDQLNKLNYIYLEEYGDDGGIADALIASVRSEMSTDKYGYMYVYYCTTSYNEETLEALNHLFHWSGRYANPRAIPTIETYMSKATVSLLGGYVENFSVANPTSDNGILLNNIYNSGSLGMVKRTSTYPSISYINIGGANGTWVSFEPSLTDTEMYALLNIIYNNQPASASQSRIAFSKSQSGHIDITYYTGFTNTEFETIVKEILNNTTLNCNYVDCYEYVEANDDPYDDNADGMTLVNSYVIETVDNLGDGQVSDELGDLFN